MCSLPGWNYYFKIGQFGWVAPFLLSEDPDYFIQFLDSARSCILLLGHVRGFLF